MGLIFKVEVHHHRWWHGTFLNLSRDSRIFGVSLQQMSPLEGRLCSHFSRINKYMAFAE